MTREPTLRGRYERSVLSPLQWSILAVIGYVVLFSLEIDALRHTSFRLELFDHEVIHVQHAPRQAPMQAVQKRSAPLLAIPEVTPLDWPPPPIPTAWSPSSPHVVPFTEIRY